jgi:proteasome lid subunit RPN8/RPN11
MADMIHQGPHTTDPSREDRRVQGQNTDLSQLSVSAHFSDPEAARLPTHTSASVEQRWGKRAFESGVVIEGRVMGGKR